MSCFGHFCRATSFIRPFLRADGEWASWACCQGRSALNVVKYSSLRCVVFVVRDGERTSMLCFDTLSRPVVLLQARVFKGSINPSRNSVLYRTFSVCAPVRRRRCSLPPSSADGSIVTRRRREARIDPSTASHDTIRLWPEAACATRRVPSAEICSVREKKR